MKKIINQMIQLQDLVEARAQQETLASHGRLAQLDESIQAMLAALPTPIAAQFQRIQRKSHQGIVPVVTGVCGGCGMGLPVSLVHSVHASKELYTCPACSRYLYFPEASAPKRIAKTKRHLEPLKVGIARFSSPDLMIPALEATERDAAIAEICTQMQAHGFVDNGARLAEEALKREAIVSTAIEHGIAFPHARGVEGGGLTLACALSAKGIRFAADQRTLTRMVFFVAIPTAASAFYLKLLAGLTKTFEDEENRTKILACKASADLWKTLIQATRRAIL